MGTNPLTRKMCLGPGQQSTYFRHCSLKQVPAQGEKLGRSEESDPVESTVDLGAGQDTVVSDVLLTGLRVWRHSCGHTHCTWMEKHRKVCGKQQKKAQFDKTNQVDKNGAETSEPNCKGDEVKPLRDTGGVIGSSGNPKSKSEEDSGDPVLSDKIQLQKKIQEADEGRLSICTSPSYRKNLEADVTVSFPLLFPLRVNALEISTQVPSAFPGHKAIKPPEA